MSFSKELLIGFLAIGILINQSLLASASDRQTKDLMSGANVVQDAGASGLADQAKRLRAGGIALDRHLSTLGEGAFADNNERLRGATDSKIFGSALPGVVLIMTANELGYGSGSGSLISEDGNILTNYHVIEDADSIVVIFYPDQGMVGTKFDILRTSVIYPAQVIRVDEFADLALLKIGTVPDTAKVLALAKAGTKPLVGDDVHALGHPRGEFWTYTRGYISQLRKEYEWGPFQEGDPPHLADVIQTQTPINPGNSGGPLLNQQGRIVGVNSFGNSDSEGLNFAVALSSIHAFLKRDKDRLFPVQEPIPQTEPVYVKLDTNKNDIIDLITEDADGNGIPETYYLDPNEDGIPDIVLWDGNENGYAEWRGYTDKISGIDVFVWEIDLDEDETVDQIGIDVDLDGEIDRFEPA